MQIRRSASAVALSLTAVLALAGCTQDEPDVPASADAEEATVETEAGVEVPAFSEAVRTAFRDGTGEDAETLGTLRLLLPVEPVDEDQAPRLSVELTGLEAGEHAWHIYDGPCTVEGGGLLIPLTDVSGTAGIAEPLRVADDGTAEAEIPVPPLNELWVEAGNYSVRVFAGSGVDYGELVACANL